MAESKQQKIIVFISLNDSDKNLILNGIRLATIFRKELCLCYNYTKKDKNQKEKIKQKLLDYTYPVKNEIPGLPVSTLLTREELTYLPEKLADDFEAVSYTHLTLPTTPYV
jgi:hypothetical protein